MQGGFSAACLILIFNLLFTGNAATNAAVFSGTRLLALVGLALLLLSGNFLARWLPARWQLPLLAYHGVLLALTGWVASLFYLNWSAYPLRTPIERFALFLSSAVIWGAWVLAAEDRRRLVMRATPWVGLVGISLFSVEAGLRAYLAEDLSVAETAPYRVNRPNLALQFEAQEGVLPGVEGRTRFSTDALGLRGSALPEAGDALRILAIGGSTTESLYVDDADAWPHRLERIAQAEGQAVWVGNAGRSGHNSLHHFVTLYYIAPQIAADVVLMLVGVNDMTPFLRSGNAQAMPLITEVTRLPGAMDGLASRTFYADPATQERLTDLDGAWPCWNIRWTGSRDRMNWLKQKGRRGCRLRHKATRSDGLPGSRPRWNWKTCRKTCPPPWGAIAKT
ncbi:MAG: SGNH/GDSL hydrolase family protein [Anaerolineae bacterium]|nr:SGNH/GDSL hydrolase family protein [Anaerolineae bacterium]